MRPPNLIWEIFLSKNVQSQQLKFEPGRKGNKMGAVCSEELGPTQETEEFDDEQVGGNERSGEWRQAILQNVDKICYVGRSPGQMVVYGKFAEPGDSLLISLR